MTALPLVHLELSKVFVDSNSTLPWSHGWKIFSKPAEDDDEEDEDGDEYDEDGNDDGEDDDDFFCKNPLMTD